ncbi:MAG: hypothetical protein ACD_76C00130G0011, partial [uncultured bacterium]
MKNQWNRKSIRLRNYDYSKPGFYFVTICTQYRECWFGQIINDKMILNDTGTMIDKWWQKLPNKYNNVRLDEFKIMPDHIHGIIQIVLTDPIGADP